MAESQPRLHLVREEDAMRALEAVRPVADEYGLAAGSLKPCIAFLLDGNHGGSHREVAWVLAMEFRRLSFNEKETAQLLERWARLIGYGGGDASRAIRSAIKSAYLKVPGGSYRYHPPGITKKPGGKYEAILGPICEAVGCPANCAPYAGTVARGPKRETWDRFVRSGWPRVLKTQRHAAAVDYYRAICELEHERGFAAGAQLLTSYRQLAEKAERDHRHAGDNLRVLFTRGLLSQFEPGSGSGPHARDRIPTRIRRAVPILKIPTRYLPAITTGPHTPPPIDAAWSPRIDGVTAPHIGGGNHHGEDTEATGQSEEPDR